jgi:arylsulfatase
VGEKVNNSFVAITDLAETCYDLAGIANPNKIDAELLASMPGKSILPALQGDVAEVHSSEETWVLEHNHHVLVRRGEWKLVNLNFDWKEEAFVLYNLKADPTESINVSDKYPDIYRELLEEWQSFKGRYKVVRFEE